MIKTDLENYYDEMLEGRKAMTEKEVDGVIFAAKALIAIVEGIDGTMAHGVWRDQHGERLKDTAEWMDLYLSVRDPKKFSEIYK